jgi:PAS domain S-box-containing protein
MSLEKILDKFPSEYGSKKTWCFPLLLWSLLVSISLFLNISVVERYSGSLVLEQGRAFFNQIVITRLWNARHGGVYVPITDKTPPNPYLNIPDRDVVTVNGLRLTKINPAYMTRQIAEIAQEQKNVLFHITSLRPIRPENAADEWEKKALNEFERGKKETVGLADYGSKKMFRYMAPLMVDDACMKCHAAQGYKAGDVRGGISVNMPAETILGAKKAQKANLITLHLGALALGVSGILIFNIRSRRHWIALKQSEESLQKAKDELETKVAERTEDLSVSNEKLRLEILHHKDAEDALRRSKEFNEAVLNSMNDAISIIDINDFRIAGVNSVFLKETGLTEQEVIGKTCYEVTHHRKDPCAAPDDICPLTDTVKHNIHASYEHTHYRKDGNKMYVEVSTSPIMDDNGKITHVVHVARDITGRRHLEDQLRHAQKMEAIGHLAGGVAHDFNNILTAIMGYGNLMSMKLKEGDVLRSYLDHMLSASERAAGLTQSLLAFSRKQIINPKPVNVNDIVKRIEKLLTRLIGEDVELKTILTNDDLTVMADAGQIEQVLMNLATNARDAMPEGGVLEIQTELVKIRKDSIKAQLLEMPGMYALITVSDTGIGMDQKTKENIFEPFFTTKEMGRGTGLGLSIVYGIIKQHNGHIDVYSEPGRGTTFKIYLPLTKVKTEEAQAVVLPPPQGGTETVLLAEDDAGVRGLLRDVLVGAGYKVIEALDGEDAVKIFKENTDSVAVAVFDVIMPKKNGREAYEEIKKTRPDFKALFMSGYTADIIHKKNILEPGLEFLSKPVNPDEFLRKIREMLDK